MLQKPAGKSPRRTRRTRLSADAVGRMEAGDDDGDESSIGAGNAGAADVNGADVENLSVSFKDARAATCLVEEALYGRTQVAKSSIQWLRCLWGP